jgi:hypothetical protein
VPQGRHPTCQEAAALGGRRPSGVNVAAASRLDHPGTVYLREVDLLPHLDGWRIGLFHPAVLDATLDALIAASQDASGAAEALRKVERTLADRHRHRKVAPLPSGAGRRGNDQRCVSTAHGTSREHLQ